MKKISRKQSKPMPKQKRFKTTLYLPEDLWKATRIRAIEMNVDATDLVGGFRALPDAQRRTHGDA